MKIDSKTHDKYKDMITTWGLDKNCEVTTVQMYVDDLINLIDEFEQLKIKYKQLAITGHYGIRPNY